VGASAHITELWLMSAMSHISSNAQATPITTPTCCMIHTVPIHDSVKADPLKNCSVHWPTITSTGKNVYLYNYFLFSHYQSSGLC